jgi:hypothetical protein
MAASVPPMTKSHFALRPPLCISSGRCGSKTRHPFSRPFARTLAALDDCRSAATFGPFHFSVASDSPA